MLAVQRPVVLAHLRSIRRLRPDARPDQVLRILERRYLTAITTGGAAVGAAASFPAVGTGTSLALSGVETVGFMESSALFAQSVAELHGIAVTDPNRARTLVMTMILGNGGRELLEQFAQQATGRSGPRSLYWGELVTTNLSGPLVGMVADRLKQVFIQRFVVTQGTSIVGRTIPFGVGAVIGGTGNHLMARRVLRSSQAAFGEVPFQFSAELEQFRREPRPARTGSREPLTVKAGGRRLPLPVLPLPPVRRALERGEERRRIEAESAAEAKLPTAVRAASRGELERWREVDPY